MTNLWYHKGPKFKHVGEQDVKTMLYPLSLGLEAIANNCQSDLHNDF
jgi:hypothetical protein